MPDNKGVTGAVTSVTGTVSVQRLLDSEHRRQASSLAWIPIENIPLARGDPPLLNHATSLFTCLLH